MNKLKQVNNLVIGAKGLVGSAIYSQLDKSERLGTSRSSKAKEDELMRLDVLDFGTTANVIECYKPDEIYFCANLGGGVNFCESNPDECVEFHLKAVKNIVDQIKGTQTALVFISSDYVFDGMKQNVLEDDHCNPLNEYGKSKRLAEQYISNHLTRYIIGRTTNIYGYDPNSKTPNYFMQVLNKLKKNEKVFAPAFLYGSPTYVKDLARATIDLVQREKWGLYHMVGPDFINRYEWAKMIAIEFGYDVSNIVLDEHEKINGVKRPKKVRLLTDKMNKSISFKFKGPLEGLLEIKKR